MSNKKEKLVIEGPKKYIEYMFKHLGKEHPKTKDLMKIKK